MRPIYFNRFYCIYEEFGDAISQKAVITDYEMRQEILNQFDTTCDICSKVLGSLANATNHYKKSHKTIGYIRCCRLKLKTEDKVEEHIEWHINPEVFRQVIQQWRQLYGIC